MNKEEIKTLYINMENALKYGEYQIALETAQKLDHIFGHEYYELYVINIIEEAHSFVRRINK